MKRLWLIQAGANLMLIALIYLWLGLRDARVSQLLANAVLGGLIVFIALWLHASVFAYFADGQPPALTPVFRQTIRRVASFAVLVILFLFVWWALNELQAPIQRAAQWTASALTFRLRKPVRPGTVAVIYRWLLWLLQWVIVPILVLPIASAVAKRGWAGFKTEAFQQSRNWRFWFKYLVVIAVGFYLPYRLIHYAPPLHNTVAELLSFAVRFGLAYFLVITGWLALAFFSSGGSPRSTQPVTAASP
ncbi:MAG: hypothetical protein M3Z36_12300 [Acidobacteriota bacterium]|nr:hypothetical protein [Acidobacteriota bacterium]